MCFVRVRWRSSFEFRSTGISSSSSMDLFVTNLNVRSSLVSLCPTNSLVMVTSFQSSEPTWKICSKSGQDALFHFVSSFSKKIIHTQIDGPSHGFSCCWAAFHGIQCFFCSNASSVSERSCRSAWTSFVPCCCTRVICSQFFQVRSRRCVEYST